jgi:hypothetical protein
MLVLVMDVSGSMSTSEYQLMVKGYSEAFRDADVRNGIYNGAGTYDSIAVGLVFFDEGQATAGWWEINDAASAEALADYFWDDATDTYLSRPLVPGGTTGVGDAIDVAYGLGLSGSEEYEATRYVMDVSGDGAANTGGSTATARDNALQLFDVINGVTIGGEFGLEQWYVNNVIGGDGAFHVHADSFQDFGDTIKDKLAREIAVTPEPGTLLLFGSAAGLLGFWRRRRTRQA